MTSGRDLLDLGIIVRTPSEWPVSFQVRREGPVPRFRPDTPRHSPPAEIVNSASEPDDTHGTPLTPAPATVSRINAPHGSSHRRNPGNARCGTSPSPSNPIPLHVAHVAGEPSDRHLRILYITRLPEHRIAAGMRIELLADFPDDHWPPEEHTVTRLHVPGRQWIAVETRDLRSQAPPTILLVPVGRRWVSLPWPTRIWRWLETSAGRGSPSVADFLGTHATAAQCV